jgi:hypothetical protein
VAKTVLKLVLKTKQTKNTQEIMNIFSNYIIFVLQWSFCLKEEYMVPLFRQLSDDAHIEALKMYLDIISSSTKAHSSHQGIQEVPVVLKQGYV